MLCEKCGAQNPDGLTRCAVCGAPLAEEKKSGKAARFDLKNMDRNKLMGFAVIAAVVLVAVILLIVLFSGRSDTSTLKKYVEATLTLDAKKLVSLFPDAYFKAIAEEEGISKAEAKEDMIDELEEYFDHKDGMYDDIDFDEIKIQKVEIRHEDKYSKKQVREANEEFEDESGVELNAKEMKDCEVKVTGKHDGDQFSFKVNITLIKIGGSWYTMTDIDRVYYYFLEELRD